jgi:hypothetical protein
MQVGDWITLTLTTTEEFTEDGKIVAKTHAGKTVAKIVSVHDDGTYDAELDDGRIWMFEKPSD